MKKFILASVLVVASCNAMQREELANIASQPVATTPNGGVVTVGDQVANSVGSAIGMATGNPIIGVAAVAALGTLIGSLVKKYKTKT